MSAIGIIGGSGLYEMDALRPRGTRKVDTPFGSPSDAYIEAEFEGKTIYFLPRHGRGHRLLPSEINHRANVYGFKTLGVDYIVAFTAVGSLQAGVEPRHILLPDQYIDRTKRNHTFFGDGVVAHVPFGNPACPRLHEQLGQIARSVAESNPAFSTNRVHVGGTYVNIEGPAFSSRAESELYRTWGCDVVGMTSLPEAKLCREAQIPYAAVALVTDYDCWHEGEEDVTAELVAANVQANLGFAQALLMELIPRLKGPWSREATHALDGAVMSDWKTVTHATRERLTIFFPGLDDPA